MFTIETARQYLDYDHGALYIYRWTHNVQIEDKNLYAHLRTCFNFLVRENCPRYVCIAGLWHSVYDPVGNDHPLKSKFDEDIVEKFVGYHTNKLLKKYGSLGQPRVDKIIEMGDTDCAYVDLATCIDTNKDGHLDHTIRRLMKLIEQKNAIYRTENI